MTNALELTLRLLIGAVVLAGCATEPKLRNPTPPGIALRAAAGQIDSTAAEAAEYCRAHGARATRESTTQTADGVIVRYACE